MTEKKRSSLKIFIISVFALFSLLSVGAIYYASTLISDEEIRKVLIQQMEKTFPNAEVELGELSISAGFSFKVKMQSLKMSLKDDDFQSTLVSLTDAVVSIPVWAILTGGGEIDISLSQPEMEYVVMGEESNWTRAMASSDVKVSVDSKSSNEIDKASASAGIGAAVAIPAFLTKSSLNLRIRDIGVLYKTSDSSARVTLSKFLIKNLNFESPTAFEIDSFLAFSMGEDQIEFSTLVIGEINVAEFISKKQLPMKAMIRTNKLKVPGLASRLAEIKTDIQFTLLESGEVRGAIKNNWDGIVFDTEINIKEESVRVFNIKMQAAPDQLLRLIDMKIPELNSGRSVLSLDGEVLLDAKGKIAPKLSFKLEPAITYTLGELVAQVQMNGTFVNTNLEANVQTELFSGIVTTKVLGQFDINEEFDLAKLKPFQTTITANNLKIPSKFIRDQIYADASKAPKGAVTNTQSSASEEAPAAPLIIPPGRIRLSMNNIQFDDKELSANGHFLLSATSVATESFTFNYARGEGKLTHVTEIRADQMRHQFDFSLKDFDLSGIDPFLPAFVGGTKGIFNTSVKGSATTFQTSDAPRYDMVLSVDATNGELIALDISEQLNQLIQRVPILKDKVGDDKSFDFDGKFQKLSFRAKASDKKAEFSRLQFIGINNKVDITGDGFIFPPPHTGRSEILLNIVDRSGKISKIMLDNIGDNNLPIKLTGPGIELSPDYEYTIGRLAKTAFDNRGRQKVEQTTQKVQQKVKEEIKEKGTQQLRRLLGR